MVLGNCFRLATPMQMLHQPKTWTAESQLTISKRPSPHKTSGTSGAVDLTKVRPALKKNKEEWEVSVHLDNRYSTLIGVLCFLLVSATLAAPVFAAQQGERDITRQELLNFDRFLDSHPAIDQDLKKNPALANDAAYLS